MSDVVRSGGKCMAPIRCVLYLAAALVTGCSSPPEALAPHESIAIDSKAFGDARQVDVYLPRNYSKDLKTYYPLVVIVGGDRSDDVARLSATFDAEVQAGRMAPAILAVVDVDAGLADLTPAPAKETDRYAEPVELPAYHRFLADELLPALEDGFRTNGRRALVGAGDAGLFVVDSMFASSWLVDDWVAIDPPLDHPAAWHPSRSANWMNQHRYLSGHLAFAWSDDKGSSAPARELESSFYIYPSNGFRWDSSSHPDVAPANAFRELASEALLAIHAPRPAGETPLPTRAPYDSSCKWTPLASVDLGIKLWVMDCAGPYRYEFSVVEDRLEQHRPADDVIFGSHVALQMFRKPAGQSIEESLKEKFIAPLPPPARDSCIVERVRRRGFGGDKLLYTLVPTGAYRDRIMTELQQYPRDFGCGPYGKTQGSTYFEYHPHESTTRYAFVIYGMDEPLFDERSLIFEGP